MSLEDLQKMRYKASYLLKSMQSAKQSFNVVDGDYNALNNRFNKEEQRVNNLIKDLEYTSDSMGRECSGYRTYLGERIYLGDRVIKKNKEGELEGTIQKLGNSYNILYTTGEVDKIEDEGYTIMLAEVN
jgi:hypothetical protein